MAVNEQENSEHQQSNFSDTEVKILKDENKHIPEKQILEKSKIPEDDKIQISTTDCFSAGGADKTSYKKFSGEQCMVKKADGEWRKILFFSFLFLLLDTY